MLLATLDGLRQRKNDRDRTTRVETGLWMMYEIVDGELVNVMKVPRQQPVEEYLSSRDDLLTFSRCPGRSPNQINSRLREL